MEYRADLDAIDDQGRTPLGCFVEPPEPPDMHENVHVVWVHREEHSISRHLRPLLASRRDRRS
jgi:hypothetical protein